MADEKKKRGRKPIENRDDVKNVRMDFVFSANQLKKFGATKENKDPMYRAIYNAVDAKKAPAEKK